MPPSAPTDEFLDANVTGSGDVHYYGNPPQVQKNVTGSGTSARADGRGSLIWLPFSVP